MGTRKQGEREGERGRLREEGRQRDKVKETRSGVEIGE